MYCWLSFVGRALFKCGGALTGVISEEDRHEYRRDRCEAAFTDAEEGGCCVNTMRMIADHFLRQVLGRPQYPKNDIEWDVARNTKEEEDTASQTIGEPAEEPRYEGQHKAIPGKHEADR